MTRDVRRTGESAVEGAKQAGDMAVNDIDDELTAGAQKIQKDANDAVQNVKNDVKKPVSEPEILDGLTAQKS